MVSVMMIQSGKNDTQAQLQKAGSMKQQGLVAAFISLGRNSNQVPRVYLDLKACPADV